MKKVYKIITLGDQSNNYDKLGVGKTSIVEAYINNRYSPVV
jgi:GTPase SAR1 family protein